MYERLVCLIFYLMVIQLTQSAPRSIKPRPDTALSNRERFRAALPNIIVPNLPNFKKFGFKSQPDFVYCGVCVDRPCQDKCRCVDKHCATKPKSILADDPSAVTKKLNCDTDEDKSKPECLPIKKRPALANKKLNCDTDEDKSKPECLPIKKRPALANKRLNCDRDEDKSRPECKSVKKRRVR